MNFPLLHSHSSCSSRLAPSEGWARAHRSQALTAWGELLTSTKMGHKALQFEGLKAGELLGSQGSGDNFEWQVHSGLIVPMEA